MTEIQLVGGQIALVDDDDVALVNQYSWGLNTQGYVVNRRNGQRRLHRMLLNARPSELVDHKDRNKLNNQRSNLRVASRLQNNRNRCKPRNACCEYKGVSKNSCADTYMSQITVEKANVYLGSYLTPEEAARAYDLAALKYHGEFASTNVTLGLLDADDGSQPKTAMQHRKRFRGVNRMRSKFQAHITVNWRFIHLGTFASESEAAHAYDEAARKYRGSRAKLNFPERHSLNIVRDN